VINDLACPDEGICDVLNVILRRMQ
jgi:hypothetical protein